MTTAIAIFLAGVVMAASGQVLIKKGATRTHSLIGSFFDPFVAAGYVLMLASTVATTISLKTMPLKITVSLQPLGFVLVVFLSVAFLREQIRRHHLWGMLLILAGMIIFNLGLG
jgi:multidrug transporter EmrE-like cation transporter